MAEIEKKVEDLQILVVDDDPQMREIVAEMLKKIGAPNIISANNAAIAAKISAETCLDIIFTDYEMPRMSGIELIREIRKEQGRGDIIIILMSGQDLLVFGPKGLRAGADFCLEKPVHYREVENILRIIASPDPPLSAA